MQRRRDWRPRRATYPRNITKAIGDAGSTCPWLVSKMGSTYKGRHLSIGDSPDFQHALFEEDSIPSCHRIQGLGMTVKNWSSCDATAQGLRWLFLWAVSIKTAEPVECGAVLQGVALEVFIKTAILNHRSKYACTGNLSQLNSYLHLLVAVLKHYLLTKA